MQTNFLLRNCLVAGIIFLFIGVALAPSISSTGVRASKAFFTQTEREALSAKSVCFELRTFKEDGSVATQRMIVPYGKALDLCSHLNISVKRNDTRGVSPRVDYGWIVRNRNCYIDEHTIGSVNFYLGTSVFTSRSNWNLDFGNLTSRDLLGTTLSFYGLATASEGEFQDASILGICLFRIYVGFVGVVASINFLAGISGGFILFNIVPGLLKFEQFVEGRASSYLAVCIPFYIGAAGH